MDEPDGGAQRSRGRKKTPNGTLSGVSAKHNNTATIKVPQPKPPAAVCQVASCGRRLSREKDYYQRYRVCKYHSAQPEVLMDGQPHRFCQQCCIFQLLSSFDGDRRSCRARLLLHNNRRKLRIESRGGASDSEQPAEEAATPRAAADKQRMDALPDALQHSRRPAGGELQAAPPSHASHLQSEPKLKQPLRRKRSAKGRGPATVRSLPKQEEQKLGTTRCSTASSSQSVELSAQELRDKPAAFSRNSSLFNVRDVAAMWARDDEAQPEIGGMDDLSAPAGLICDLNPFASFSGGYEAPAETPQPPQMRSSSHDDASDFITMPAGTSEPVSSGTQYMQLQAAGSQRHREPSPQRFMPTGMHPIAAALSRTWAQNVPAPPPPLPLPAFLMPDAQPPKYQPSPTAQLLKRHWSKTQDLPKSHFARVSWGSGSGGKHKRQQSISGDSAATDSQVPALAAPQLQASISPAAQPGNVLAAPNPMHATSPAVVGSPQARQPAGGSPSMGPHDAGPGSGFSLLKVHTGSGQPFMRSGDVHQLAGMGLGSPVPPAQLPPHLQGSPNTVAGIIPPPQHHLGSPSNTAGASPAGSEGRIGTYGMRQGHPQDLLSSSAGGFGQPYAALPAMQPAMQPAAQPGFNASSAALQHSMQPLAAGAPPHSLQPLAGGGSIVSALGSGGFSYQDTVRTGSWQQLQPGLVPEPVQNAVLISGRVPEVQSPFSVALLPRRGTSFDGAGVADGHRSQFMYGCGSYPTGGSYPVGNSMPASSGMPSGALLQDGLAGSITVSGFEHAHAGQTVFGGGGASAGQQPQPGFVNPYSVLRRQGEVAASRVTTAAAAPVPHELTPLWATRADLQQQRRPQSVSAQHHLSDAPTGNSTGAGTGRRNEPQSSRRESLCTVTARQLTFDGSSQ